MTTDGELMDHLHALAAGLPEVEREPFAVALATAHEQAQSIAAASSEPATVWPLVVTLLAAGSTRAGTVSMATALVEAARAHAAVWALENQIAAFRQQLDASDGPADA